MKTNKNFWQGLIILLAVLFTGNLRAQVTIGDENAPQSYSVLELISKYNSGPDKFGGLRLPQLTTAQRDGLALSSADPLAKGLVIYNTTINCVEYWNNQKWISLCSGGSSIIITVPDGEGKKDPFNPNDPNFTVFHKDGETKGPYTPEVTPNCSQNPPFQVFVINGGEYSQIVNFVPATGAFKLKMDRNPTVRMRYAIVRVINNCDGDFRDFLFSQNAQDAGDDDDDDDDGDDNPAKLPLGRGTFNGRTCFDIARSNDGTNGCAALTARASYKADFTTADNTQVYTFTPIGAVSKVRFAYVEKNGAGLIVQSFTPSASYEGLTNITTACTLTVVYKSSLNTEALGLTNQTGQPLLLDIYAIFNDKADGTGTDRAIKITAKIKDCACCGALNYWGEWVNFMCHNLGADESLDPFTWNNTKGTSGGFDIKGDLYQWGRPRDGHEKRNSTVQNGVPASGRGLSKTIVPTHGNFIVTGSAYIERDWVLGAGNDSRWGDTGTEQNSSIPKAANDPCPDGWKVPSKQQWDAICKELSFTTWPAYSNGQKIGNLLYLPTTYLREGVDGDIPTGTGNILGIYWASTSTPTSNHRYAGNSAFFFMVTSTDGATNARARADGCAVRCIEDK